MRIEAIEILKEAYGLRREGFLNPRFASLYHKWCEVTGYENIDGEHFRFQVKEYGEPMRQKDKYIHGKRRDIDNLFKVSNRMLDPENLGDFIEKKNLGSRFVEKHREDLMRRMFRGSRR